MAKIALVVHLWKALVEKENVGFDLTKSDLYLSFIEDLTAKGMGLRALKHNLGEDPIRARKEGLRAREEGTSLSLPVKCNVCIYDCIAFDFNHRVNQRLYQIVLNALNDMPICHEISCSLNVDYSRVGLEMAFRNFIYAENEEDLSLFPKEPSLSFGTGLPSVLVNTEPPPPPLRVDVKPKLKLVEDTTYYGGSLKPERHLAPGSLSSRATHAKTSSSKDGPLFLIVFNDDEGLPDVFKLKDANACHLEIFAITPLNWKNHLVIEKIRGEYDVMKERKRAREEECDKLRTNQKWAGYQVSLSALELKVSSLKAKKASDEFGRLVGKLVSFVILYGRCAAFEQVDGMKEPFDLSKVKGYRPSYKKEHTQAGNELATPTFP
uniref:Uncharacterized protein n=1 Tax=Tanacetum cinerariifolium TaxID=118510 RepID=A0A6L2JT98_TANCI|nr:hypothetical protein [Tanacetum cinerariifolium]